MSSIPLPDDLLTEAQIQAQDPDEFKGRQFMGSDTFAFWRSLDPGGGYAWTQVGGGGGGSGAVLVVLDYEDASVSGETGIVYPDAGIITWFGVVNFAATTGFANNFALAINGSTVDGGEITIPGSTPFRTAFTTVPTAENVLTPGDVVQVLVGGGSNVYAAGLSIKVEPLP